MSRETPEIAAARRIAEEAEGLLHRSPAFRELAAESQGAILRDLGTIRRGLAAGQSAADPYALTLETPWERTRRGAAPGTADAPAPAANGSVPAPKKQATETLAARTGALVDEIDFPAFVAGLVHSTFDAIVESTIRQMEAFAELVSSLARSVDDFTRDNISPNQVRDWLRDKYPADLGVELPPPGAAGQPRLRAKAGGGGEEGDEAASPGWLADFGLAGEPLTDELLEERVLPVARRQLGEHRMQMLSTMVLLGMNRVNVKDGSISAKVRFRAAAADHTRVDYAVGADPSARAGWGDRGSPAYAAPSTMVSTVGVNAQSDSELKAELFGEVRINFVSETLPLDRFVDLAQMQILQSHARAPAPAPVVAPPAAPVLLPPAAAVPAPVAVAAPGTP